MGKKVKVAEEEPQAEKESKVIRKSKKAEVAEEPSTQIFSAAIYDKVNSFINLTREVLVLKEVSSGVESTGELETRKTRVNKKLEDQCSIILKDELTELEGWIVDEQTKVEAGVVQIEKAYEATRASLLSTGAFTEEEIKTQLSSIQAKASEKKSIVEKYASILNRARQIYS